MNCGKLDIVELEMERNKVNLLGTSKLKWIGRGYFCSDKMYAMYLFLEMKPNDNMA